MKEEQNKESKMRIGISIGDLNGIGPELVIRTFMESKMFKYMTPVVYASVEILEAYQGLLDGYDLEFKPCQDAAQARERCVNVVNCLDEPIELALGKATKDAGKAAFRSLEKATQDLRDGSIDALVTCPINKETMQQEGFKFPGHTEYFAKTFDQRTIMMMCSDRFRVGMVTGHVPLAKVSQVLSKQRVAGKLELLRQSLVEDFGILRPKIAVLGLNPHAGENGLLGGEEKETILPVIDAFKEKGHFVFGPFPADGFFGMHQHSHFDGVLAMYHDQGLIPFKYIAFDSGVNFTAGLPIVRTSPDHGTAYDIAGKGKADIGSFRAALHLAKDIAKIRQQKTSNQLRRTFNEKRKTKPQAQAEASPKKQDQPQKPTSKTRDHEEPKP